MSKKRYLPTDIELCAVEIRALVNAARRRGRLEELDEVVAGG